jgi:hypothetical protein
MTPEAQRIAIAETCGYEWWVFRDARTEPFYQIIISSQNWMERQGGKRCQRPSGKLDLSGLPDYLNDLNAMHEAEGVLDSDAGRFNQWCKYWEILETITGSRTFDKDIADDCKGMIHATAAQRAEAFLRTIGEWSTASAPRVDSPL